LIEIIESCEGYIRVRECYIRALGGSLYIAIEGPDGFIGQDSDSR
jgi:hypothetical protein